MSASPAPVARTPPAADSRPRWQTAAVPLLPLAATLAVYARTLQVYFVGDDALIVDRVADAGGIGNPLRFFQLAFFEYYRPIAFLSFAIDWEFWGLTPFGFHLTSLLLHGANVLLVYLLAARLAGPMAGAIAALIFGIHPANHEAVAWMAGRFDLLASFFVLLALWFITRPGRASYIAGVSLFALALFSKESALAFPVMAGAHDVFIRRLEARRVILRLAPILAVTAVYAWLRSGSAGLAAAGGLSRAPKVVALGVTLALLVWLAHAGWQRLLPRLGPLRARLAAIVALGLLLAAAAARSETLGVFAREKLSFAGFATYYLVTPVLVPTPPPYFLDPSTPVYWVGGLLAAAAVAGVALTWWRAMLGDGRLLFAILFVASALLPVSSMTEGKRYVYLASAGAAMIAGLAIQRLDRARPPALAALALVSVLFAWQASIKVSDWIWAGRMTRETIASVDRSLAPACEDGVVIFLTAPDGVRDVYCHFYRESFALARGCTPTMRTLLRVVRLDAEIEAEWAGPATIRLHAPGYRGNLVASADLRNFNRPLRASRTLSLSTPIGHLHAVPEGDGQTVHITLDPAVVASKAEFFYYGSGTVQRLPRANEAGRAAAPTAGARVSRAPAARYR